VVATSKNRTGNGVGGHSASVPHPAEVVTSGGYDLPPVHEQVSECQYMNLTTLREVFAARMEVTKKQARGASLIFRGVSGQLRTLEFGQRE
jgi:hypothetical protein